MTNEKVRELLVITKTRNLLVHYCEVTKKAPKEYHRDLCRDVKFLIKEALHLERQANKIYLYEKKRYDLQMHAWEKLERVNDLLPALEKLGANVLTEKSCGALQRELHEVFALFDAWVESDRNTIKEKMRRLRRNAGYELHKAKERYDLLKKYYLMLPERDMTAGDLDLVRVFDEAGAEVKLRKKEFERANEAYTKEIERLEQKRLEKEQRYHQKFVSQTPPICMENEIKQLLSDHKSDREIFEIISKKKLLNPGDSRIENDRRIEGELKAKEKKRRDNALNKYGLKNNNT